MEEDVRPSRIQFQGGRKAGFLVAAREDDAVAVLEELLGGLEPQAAVRAGDERDRAVGWDRRHARRPRRRLFFLLWGVRVFGTRTRGFSGRVGGGPRVGPGVSFPAPSP